MSSVVDAVSGTIQILLISLNLHSIQQRNSHMKQTGMLVVSLKGVNFGGGDSHMKQTGMLVVSLRGVNFGSWSRLGCSVQSANILSRQGLV